MLKTGLIVFVVSIGLTEAYCIVEGHINALILLEILNRYIDFVYCEKKRWNR